MARNQPAPKGNMLIAQSGGPTVVINQSLVGAVLEARKYGHITHVYGARHGVSGIVNVLPFSCMPGMIVMSMAHKLRDRMGGVPWLDVAFDGQRETNLHTRLGAFMHQALQFHRQRATPEAACPRSSAVRRAGEAR